MKIETEESVRTKEICKTNRIALLDTLEVIQGKWKLVILFTLIGRPYRFSEFAKEIGITPRMLSRELHDLEEYMLISRTVLQTKPITVEYAITEHGETFHEVMRAMRDWGLNHREKLIKIIRESKRSRLPASSSIFQSDN